MSTDVTTPSLETIPVASRRSRKKAPAVPDASNGEDPSGPSVETSVDDAPAPNSEALEASPQEVEAAPPDPAAGPVEVAPAAAVEDCQPDLQEDKELRVAIMIRTHELFAERSKGRELEQAEEVAADEHKKAKKRREAQDEAIKECIDALEALVLNEPNSQAYPLFDKPSPAPASTTSTEGESKDDFFLRRRRETTFESLDLTPKITEILGEAGFFTIADLDKLFSVNKELTSINVSGGSITESRSEKILEALAAAVGRWTKEWDSLNANPIAGTIGGEEPTDG